MSYISRNIRTVASLVILLLAAGQFVFLSIPAAHGQPSNLRLSIHTELVSVNTDQLGRSTFSSIEKNVFSIDENIYVTVTISNIGSEDTILQFGSSCQASFNVTDSYGVSWYDYSRHYLCLETLTSLTLAGGQSHDFTFLWDQHDDNAVHVFAPADYVVVGRVLIASWSGQKTPAPVMTRITIQSSVAGDLYHPALVEGLSVQLVLIAPWALLAGFTILPFASIVWRKIGTKTVFLGGGRERSGSSRTTRLGLSFTLPGWLSMAGGSLTLLNGLFFANFGFLLSASYLSDFSYTKEIILVGVVSSAAGFAAALCGLMLGHSPGRRILLGATILTLSIFSSFGFFYFYNRLGFYAIYPTGLSLGNIIASAGGMTALALKPEGFNRCSNRRFIL